MLTGLWDVIITAPLLQINGIVAILFKEFVRSCTQILNHFDQDLFRCSDVISVNKTLSTDSAKVKGRIK